MTRRARQSTQWRTGGRSGTPRLLLLALNSRKISYVSSSDFASQSSSFCAVLFLSVSVDTFNLSSGFLSEFCERVLLIFMFLGSMEQWANGLGAVEKSSEPRRAHCEPVVAPQHHSEEEVGINCNDIEPQRSCKLDAAILHVHHHTYQLPPLWILNGDIESHFILGNFVVARWEAGGNKKPTSHRSGMLPQIGRLHVADTAFFLVDCLFDLCLLRCAISGQFHAERKKGGKSLTKFYGAMHSQVIGFLGEALARMTAIQAMEEYGVSQYASSIQFINKLITAAR